MWGDASLGRSVEKSQRFIGWRETRMLLSKQTEMWKHLSKITQFGDFERSTKGKQSDYRGRNPITLNDLHFQLVCTSDNFCTVHGSVHLREGFLACTFQNSHQGL